ncbi:MAG: SET domain-containing protein [Bacteroidetes bacterium]|nr:SET domain-containing protein [Bacteroidota bacterium]
MNKEQLLQELRNNTFVTLKPSPVAGIGVFALIDIKKGQRNIFSKDTSEWISISKEEVATLPQHSRALIENFCLFDEENYFVPEYGFKMADLVTYLNHNDQPNIISINDGEDFEAIRDIRAGEELFIDYGEIVESEE